MDAYPNYAESFVVYRHDADFLGRLKPGSLLRYAQQAAVDQNTLLGLDNRFYVESHLAYLIVRQSLEFTRVPCIDEKLTFLTVPEKTRHATNKRLTLVQDAQGEQVACVDSRWVLVDTDSRRILRRSDPRVERFWNDRVEGCLPQELPKASALTALAPRQADYLLCDLNGHINNCCYADLACASVPLALVQEKPIRSLRIAYHREVELGQTLTLSAGEVEGGWYTVGGRADGTTAFEAFCSL